MAVIGALTLLVCLGLALTAPGVLIVVLILATPALIRTILQTSRPNPDNPFARGPNVATLFLSSLGIVAVVGLASGVAFFTTCFVVCLGGLSVGSLNRGGPGDWILYVSVGAGGVVGLVVAICMLWLLWPQKNR
jgi:hypothetical protein